MPGARSELEKEQILQLQVGEQEGADKADEAKEGGIAGLGALFVTELAGRRV